MFILWREWGATNGATGCCLCRMGDKHEHETPARAVKPNTVFRHFSYMVWQGADLILNSAEILKFINFALPRPRRRAMLRYRAAVGQMRMGRAWIDWRIPNVDSAMMAEGDKYSL